MFTGDPFDFVYQQIVPWIIIDIIIESDKKRLTGVPVIKKMLLYVQQAVRVKGIVHIWQLPLYAVTELYTIQKLTLCNVGDGNKHHDKLFHLSFLRKQEMY